MITSILAIVNDFAAGGAVRVVPIVLALIHCFTTSFALSGVLALVWALVDSLAARLAFSRVLAFVWALVDDLAAGGAFFGRNGVLEFVRALAVWLAASGALLLLDLGSRHPCC